MGLLVASINCAIVCVIGMHTGQYGFIPANLFCIIMYTWSIQSWRRDRKPALVRAAAPAAPTSYTHPQPRTRAVAPSRKIRSGLFLAYSASSCAPIEPQAANSEHPAANILMNSGSATEVKTAN